MLLYFYAWRKGNLEMEVCIFIEYIPGSVGSLGDGSKPVSGGLCPPQEDSLLPLQHI